MSGRFCKDDVASDWESYLCNVNDLIASVCVDLGLRHIAPIAGYPVLAWLFIRLQKPKEDGPSRGLSADEEFDALCKYEDDLELTLAEHEDCLYVGRITTNGMRQFYFFITPEADFKAIVDDVLKKHQDYMYQIGQKDDAAWNQYLRLLVPGEHGWDQINRRRADREASDS
jgi:hypothetical protein